MRHALVSTLVVSVLVLSVSCSYHRAHFYYADYADKIPLSGSAPEGERLGPVAANDAGAIWVGCTKSARGTVWQLMDQTRELGGNAVGEIRWLPKTDTRTTEEPTCKKKWGWVLVWPVLITPAFLSTRAEGYAYRVPEGAETAAGLYLIPETHDERRQLVDRILAENPLTGP
jgi:hypothetical protein